MDWKLSIISIFATIAAFCTIPFISIDDSRQENSEWSTTTTNVIEVVV